MNNEINAEVNFDKIHIVICVFFECSRFRVCVGTENIKENENQSDSEVY